MKMRYMLVAVACVSLIGFATPSGPALAQTRTADFNVGMRIVDPCVMKGKKWESQCVQLKRQRSGQKRSNANKPVKTNKASKQSDVRQSLAD